MEERTTSELIEKLGSDVDRCHAELIEALDNASIELGEYNSSEFEFEARQLIRSILAYIEAVTFSVKVKCVQRCMDSGIPVSPLEKLMAIEVSAEINDTGEIVERPARIRLAQNIRFAFRMLEKVSGSPIAFDPKDEWWSCFRETIRVRDRLTHPRMPEDIDISGSDIISAIKAKNGFDSVLLAEIATDD